MTENNESNNSLYEPRVPDEFKTIPLTMLPSRAPALGFIQDTSAHGVANIFNSRGIIFLNKYM